MSAISRPSDRVTESKSGGKMVRHRRTNVARPTPYDRPTPRLLPNSSSRNPNWLSRLLLSPPRLIATGAVKVFSSVFGSESSDSSSSSSSDDEEEADEASTSEAEMEDAYEIGGNDPSYGGEKNQTTEIVNYSKKDPSALEWRTETMRVVAQLLTQETFSREECDRLTRIIKSRVVDSPITGGAEDGRLSENHGKTVSNDADVPDLRNTAVTEAKKWFEGKKLRSNSKSEEYGICTLNTASHATEGEGDSPVDLAKSYMQARPLWASPSSNSFQLHSPFQTEMATTSYLLGGNSVSPSKLNRDSPVTGSWNIQEELRKVRSRATEEILRTRPSSKIDLSPLGLSYRGSPSLLDFGNLSGAKDRLSNFTQLVDVPLKWGSTATTKSFTDSPTARDRLQNEALPPNAATRVLEQSQDLGSTPPIEGRTDQLRGLWDGSEGFLSHERLQLSEEVNVPQSADVNASSAADGPKDTKETGQPLSSSVDRIQDAIPDTTIHEANGSASKEVTGIGITVTANGFPSPASSLPAAEENEQKDTLSSEGHEPVNSDRDRKTKLAIEGTCELLSEASVEVPIVNDSDGVAVVSEDSSSMHQEGTVQAPSLAPAPAPSPARPGSKRQLASRTTRASEKGRARNVSSRYNRPARARGK